MTAFNESSRVELEAKIVNLTPHPVHIYGENDVEDGPLFSYPPSGQVARIAYKKAGMGIAGDIIYSLVEYGDVENVPAIEPGTYYIVSLVTALAVRSRYDLLAPFEEIRNSEGTVIGCKLLQRVWSR